MKTALVIGINGNFGSEMARKLIASNWRVKALIRPGKALPELLTASDVIYGDAHKVADVMAAAVGVDLLVYAANPAYHRWHQEALPMLEASSVVAEHLGLRILFPGNVYSYQPRQGLIDEQAEHVPPTDKGRIRVQMERRLHRASNNGAQVTILRAGDFLGENMHFGWLDQLLKKKHGRWTMAMPHDETHIHFWSYLPDLCANGLTLVENAVEDYEVWHDPGLCLSTQDWKSGFEQLAEPVKFSQFPWPLFWLIAWFSPLLKEVMKMRYLWQQPVLLDGTKTQLALGAQRVQTPFPIILKRLIKLEASISSHRSAVVL